MLRAAREADVLPYFHVLTSPAMPVVEMEGAERIMLGSNNYLGLTGDERVLAGAEDALHRYGTGLTGSRLLNGTIPLHLELEQEIAEWMGTEEALVFTHRAPGQPRRRSARPARPARHRDRRLRRPRLDPRRLPALAREAARLPPQPPGQAREDARSAPGDGGGVLVVVDGVFSMEGDIAPLPEICELCERYGARLMVDEAHGAGVLGARGAGASELLGVEDRVDLRMGTFSKSLASCGGFVAGSHEVIEYLRISSRAVPLHRLRRSRRARRGARGAARAALRGRAAAARARARQRPAPARRPATSSASPSSPPRRCPTAARVRAGRPACARDRRVAAIVTPIVPVLVGDDWKAALLWRALYDAGVFVNTALHPAVPPGGALLRTSVMATHDARHARPGARGLRPRQARVRGRARPAARPGSRPAAATPRLTSSALHVRAATCPASAVRPAIDLSICSQVRRPKKRSLLAKERRSRG